MAPDIDLGLSQAHQDNGIVHDFVRQMYIQGCKKYIEYRTRTGGGLEADVATLIQNAWSVLGQREARVLDIGCGFGGHLGGLNIENYVGLDLSLALLALHPLRGKSGVKLGACDIRDVMLESLRYELVFGALVLNYIKDLRALLKRLRIQGSSFCFVLPNPEFDRHMGVVNGGVVQLQVEHGPSFAYYSHSMDSLLDALQPGSNMWIEMSPHYGDLPAPAYVCVYGYW